MAIITKKQTMRSTHPYPTTKLERLILQDYDRTFPHLQPRTLAAAMRNLETVLGCRITDEALSRLNGNTHRKICAWLDVWPSPDGEYGAKPLRFSNQAFTVEDPLKRLMGEQLIAKAHWRICEGSIFTTSSKPGARSWRMLVRFIVDEDSLSEIGADEGVCPERVRQIVLKQFRKLAHESSGLKAIYPWECQAKENGSE